MNLVITPLTHIASSPGPFLSRFGLKNQYFFNISKILHSIFFIFCMNLEPIKAFNLSNMSYFRKFLFAGGKGSKVKFGSDFSFFGHISSTVSPIFLIFCMNELSHNPFKFILYVKKFHLFSAYYLESRPFFKSLGLKINIFLNILKILH